NIPPAASQSGATGDSRAGAPAPATDDPILTGPTPIDPVRADARLAMDNPDVPLPLPSPYTLLPERYGELNGDAARMRSAGYQILMHSTWAQPVAGESATRAVILDRSGDPDVRAWPILQGSITLHLSRYLHVNTRLWLNTDGSYLHPEWRMPEPPRAPPSLDLTLPALDAWQPAPVERAPGLEVTRPDGRIAQELPPVEEALTAAAPAEVQPDADAGYPWRHAILLEQSRRMRGGELHYLDHPVFGVLIKMTLLEDSDLRDLYRETGDWAWEDRHNVVITDGESVIRPRDKRP
ncbi:MAG: CsiV family protein, partial [Chromatocurvus sp.]